MKLIAKLKRDPEPILTEFLFDLYGGKPKNIGITFGAFLPVYIEQYAKVYKKSWKKDEQRAKSYLMSQWKERPLSSITRHDFRPIFMELGRLHPIAANRLKETIHVMFKQAIVLGYLPENYTSPTFGIRSFRERPRKERLHDSEIPKLFEALRAYPNQTYAKAIEFILHTGLRHRETIQLQWKWIDPIRKLIVVPSAVTKNSDEHTIPISSHIEKLLAEIKELNPESKYLFPTKLPRRGDQHIARLDKHWKKIKAEAGIERGLCIHDLRRTIGCMITEDTGSTAATRDLLNHTDQHVTAVYGFFSEKALAGILEKHGQKLAECKRHLSVVSD